MYDRSLLFELLLEIEEAIRRIERRFTVIKNPDDFIANDEGLDRLDSISMMLIAISENIRRIDRMMGDILDNQYPEIPWSDIKGIRFEQAYGVRIAPGAKLGINSVMVQVPDLILLDIKMPDMDGYTVCQQLKANNIENQLQITQKIQNLKGDDQISL